MQLKKSARAQLFIEVLLSLFILAVILMAVSSILSLAPRITFYSERSQQIQNLLQEYHNIALSFRDNPQIFGSPATSSRFYFWPSPTSSVWLIASGTENVVVDGQIHQRYLTVEAATSSSAKLIRIYLVSTSTTEVADIFIGKNKNSALVQDEWLRGNVVGPLLKIQDEFATKTNLATGTALRLQ